MKSNLLFPLLFFCLSAVSCAQSTGIFPSVSVSTSESEAVLPNPVSIAVDEANAQIVVVNSNVDMLFGQGSLAVLSVDASDTAAPTLTAQKILATPNYAGEAHFDGVSSLYVPFRESYQGLDTLDTMKKYTVAASDVTEALTGTVAPDPFGITGDGASLYVVSNDTLGIYDTSLGLQASVSLTTAETAGIADTSAVNVLSVAVDATLDIAVISNPGGRMFIVDLATNTLRQAVDGPESTRNVLIDDAGIMYILDAITEAVWVFDLNSLALPVATPESVEDSSFLVTSVSVGNGPYGMALDSARNRLYVGNFDDDSVSVVDTLTLQEVDRISLRQDDLSSYFLRDCDGPFALSTGTFNTVPYVFVACFLSHDVVMINTQTLRLVEIFPNTVL
ncbi:MAG: hypothetical protein HQM16_01440 [Deltaproteobacteria bacterium]|nr:hypothetical protein [Deltaproteobacteria bacterium]